MLQSDETVKKMAEQFKDQKLDAFMMECVSFSLTFNNWFLFKWTQKVTEAVFKELKLIKNNTIDKDAMTNHLDKELKEAFWKAPMKEAVVECHKDLMAEKDKIISELEKAPFNIKKDQCNVLYMSMVTCIHLSGFIVSLKTNLNGLTSYYFVIFRHAQKKPGLKTRNAVKQKHGSKNAVTTSTLWDNWWRSQENKENACKEHNDLLIINLSHKTK